MSEEVVSAIEAIKRVLARMGELDEDLLPYIRRAEDIMEAYSDRSMAITRFRDLATTYHFKAEDLATKMKLLTVLLTDSDGGKREALSTIVDDYVGEFQSAIRRLYDSMAQLSHELDKPPSIPEPPVGPADFRGYGRRAKRKKP